MKGEELSLGYAPPIVLIAVGGWVNRYRHGDPRASRRSSLGILPAVTSVKAIPSLLEFSVIEAPATGPRIRAVPIPSRLMVCR